ncbi:MAG: SEC-C metal-binding domain-containing protein [Acidimicrobiia bacterium]
MNKVGRIQPCPCGSGLKFKRCHGRRSQADGELAGRLTPPEMVGCVGAEPDPA